jgi:hypothetical protein
MSKDRYERRHRRTWRNANCVAMMAAADFSKVPSLAEAMGLADPQPETRPMPTTCNHRLAEGLTGLCPACQADFDEDGSAWLEYGPHPVGERNWADLRAELDAERRRVAAAGGHEPDPDMPL